MVTSIRRGRGAVGSGKGDMLFVSFILGGTNYGVEVDEVYGIYHGLPIIPTPDSPHPLSGEIQLVDRRIPIVNLHGVADSMQTRSCLTPHWILIVDSTKGPVGFVVDRVHEVVRFAPGNVTVSEDSAPGPVGSYVMAVAENAERRVYLPDFSRLLNDTVQ